MNLILASASPRRQTMMDWLGVEFEIIPSDFDESLIEQDEIEDLVETIALHKAKTVAELNPDSVVIGADTMVSLDGQHMGKARDKVQAVEYLETLSGKTHQVATGVVIIDPDQDQPIIFSQTSTVTFRQLNTQEILEYLATDIWQDKAAAYTIQDDPFGFINGYDGSYTNIVGLPILRVAEELANLGFTINRDINQVIEMNTGRREN